MTRTRRTIPPMLGPKEIAHMFLMGTALVMIVVGMDRLRRPGAMEWMLPPDPSKPAAATRRTPTASSPKAAPSGPYNPLGLVQTEECKEVNRDLLKPIKDKTPRSADDRLAIFQLLCVASTTPPDVLASQSRTDVQFANLYNDPKDYRGRPIHVHGVLARLTAWENKDEKNPYGLPAYYEAWIFTEGQPTNPVVVLLSQLPEGLAPSTSLKENVAVDAYFLKLLAYQTQEEKWKAAPLLIGGALIWERVEGGGLSQEAIYAGLILASIIALGALVFWWQNRRDDQLSERFHSAGAESTAAELGFLDSTPGETAPSREASLGKEEQP